MKRWNAGIRFLTFSCFQRLPLLGHPAIRDVLARTLAQMRERHAFKLYAWVVMPEHVHLLLLPADGHDVATPLRALKVAVAMTVIERWRTLKAPILQTIQDSRSRVRFWQRGGGFDRVCRDTSAFARHVRYIHSNPVERGLVAAPTEWTWSSARWWNGSRDELVACDPPPDDCMGWGHPFALAMEPGESGVNETGEAEDEGDSHQSLRD